MKHYFASMKQYSWIILVCLILSLAGGYYISKHQSPVYSVNSVFAVTGYSQGGINATSPNDLLAVATNYAAQVPTRTIMSYVIQNYPEIARRGYTADDLIVDVVAAPSTTTATVILTATANKPEDAVLLTNSVADGFSTYIQSQAQAQLDAQHQDLENQYKDFQTDSDNLAKEILGYPTGDPHVALLTSQRDNDLAAMSDLQKQISALPPTAPKDVQVVQHAKLLDVAVSSKSSQVIAATTGLGLILGMLVMLLVIFLDKRLRNEEQVKEKLGMAYIGGISTSNDLKSDPTRLSGSTAQEYADVIANLRLTGVLTGQMQVPNGSVLLITSPQAAEGKTTLTAGLATIAARSGQLVVVIDGNLSQPGTHLAFGVPPAGPGLNGLLKVNSNIDDGVVRSNIPGVWLLPINATLDASAVVLEQKMPAILSQLRKKVDLVIIDGPALLSGADASVLASMADGVALVIDARYEKLPLMKRSRDILNALTKTPAGLLVNHKLRRRGGKNQYYVAAMSITSMSERWIPVTAHSGNGNGNGYHENGNEQRVELVPGVDALGPGVPPVERVATAQMKRSTPPLLIAPPSPLPSRPPYRQMDAPAVPTNPPSPPPRPGPGPRQV